MGSPYDLYAEMNISVNYFIDIGLFQKRKFQYFFGKLSQKHYPTFLSKTWNISRVS